MLRTPKLPFNGGGGGAIHALTQHSRPRSSLAAGADTTAACGLPAVPDDADGGGPYLCQRRRDRVLPVLPVLLLSMCGTQVVRMEKYKNMTTFTKFDVAFFVEVRKTRRQTRHVHIAAEAQLCQTVGKTNNQNTSWHVLASQVPVGPWAKHTFPFVSQRSVKDTTTVPGFKPKKKPAGSSCRNTSKGWLRLQWSFSRDETSWPGKKPQAHLLSPKNGDPDVRCTTHSSSTHRGRRSLHRHRPHRGHRENSWHQADQCFSAWWDSRRRC